MKKTNKNFLTYCSGNNHNTDFIFVLAEFDNAGI